MKSREQTLQNYLRNLSHYNSIWKPVKATNKPIAPVPPLRVQTQDHSELWARNDKEKVELFADHLSKVFTPHENRPDQAIEDDITTLPQNTLPIKILGPKEIKEEIDFLDIKKAPDIHKITSKMMKELPKRDWSC
jgi:hypothetical protein